MLKISNNPTSPALFFGHHAFFLHMSDELPDQLATRQVALQIFALPFDAHRFLALETNSCLFLIYQLHRWQWHDKGIVPFLTALDQSRIACTCYASHVEHSERQTDDRLTLSPSAENGAVTQHFA